MRRLLLIGAGHAHAQVLRDWVHQPVPGVELVLVSPAALAPYSGMVPGWLAGTYSFDDICINFEALAAAAGARWVPDELASLDAGRRSVTLVSGAVLGFDLLSLNVGSTLTPPASAAPGAAEVAGSGGAAMLSLRPLGRLHAAWDHQLAAITAQASDAPFTVTAVGGGAAGFECLLAVLARLRALRPGRPVRGVLVSRASRLLPGLAPGAVRAAGRALAQAGVHLQLATDWRQALLDRSGPVQGPALSLADSPAINSALSLSDSPALSPAISPHNGLVLWATGAEAHAWQRCPARRGGLAVSEAGFIRVDRQLRSVSHPAVYAVGDCAQWAPPLPKAGVFAVRMGPVLSQNLRAALGCGVAGVYRPQRRFLALLATGDGRAIGAWGGWSAQGRWLWRCKDHIDRQFLRGFAAAAPGDGPGPPRPAQPVTQPPTPPPAQPPAQTSNRTPCASGSAPE